MDAEMAKKTWELENNIETLPASDDIYKYDAEEQKQILSARPWDKDPHFFKDIKISALALLKMVMHARSGGALEVMGLLQGKVDGNTMIVMDCFALPVEGTETRVNAQAQGTGSLRYPYFSYNYLISTFSLRIHDHLHRNGQGSGSLGKCYRLVSQSSRLRLLVIWNRCVNSNVESKLPRAICGNRCRSRQNCFVRKGLLGCFQNLSKR
jgi:hypothetical protein